VWNISEVSLFSSFVLRLKSFGLTLSQRNKYVSRGATVYKPAEGSIQPPIQCMSGLYPQRGKDSRCPLLSPSLRTGGDILHSATPLHCIRKHIVFNSIKMKVATAVLSVQCDIENRVDSLGKGLRVPVGTRDFSTAFTKVTMRSRGLTCIWY
jgi:hypothetical protein